MIYLNLLIGFVLGFFSAALFILYRKRERDKRGTKAKDYSGLPIVTRLKDTLRHIVFEYNIKVRNNDFLLNITLKGNTVMQIMHRAHFPELCQDEQDIQFGLALYIPVTELTSNQKLKLSQIIDEELEIIHKSKFGELEYQILDIGKRIRFGGYILSRIINEVYYKDIDDLKLSLFSEGNLPYWRN